MSAAAPVKEWTPVPILMYHAVEDKPRPNKYRGLYVLADEFAWQMHYLQRKGYTAITFDDLAAALSGAKTLPPRPFVLTFDDGYANLYENAHPLLRSLGIPCTVFLVSERVGGRNEWDAAQGLETVPLLSWSQIRAMQAEGSVSFQPHTATHPRLTEISAVEARRELGESKTRLEQELQQPMKAWLIPRGCSRRRSRRVQAFARLRPDHRRSGCGQPKCRGSGS